MLKISRGICCATRNVTVGKLARDDPSERRPPNPNADSSGGDIERSRFLGALYPYRLAEADETPLDVEVAWGSLAPVESWTVLSRKMLLDRRWLAITEERVRLPNGTIIDEFHVLHTPNWASVIAVTEAEDVLLVEQYRHGLGRTSLELPSGVIDPGEEPLDAAKRELYEETGYTADDWSSLMDVSPEPSRSTHRAYFFVAHGAVRAGQACPEASEVIALRPRKIEQVLSDVMAGRIDHAAHVGAIIMAERRGLLRKSVQKT
jgi:8-oxo-dGTP pyrophosphatase MutT (NUDIX family)